MAKRGGERTVLDGVSVARGVRSSVVGVVESHDGGVGKGLEGVV